MTINNNDSFMGVSSSFFFGYKTNNIIWMRKKNYHILESEKKHNRQTLYSFTISKIKSQSEREREGNNI